MPDALVVIAPGPQVGAQIALPVIGLEDERAVVERVTGGAGRATVRWRVTSGCCTDLVEYQADLVQSATGGAQLTGTREVVRRQTLDVSRFRAADFQHPAGHVACRMSPADEVQSANAICTLGDSTEGVSVPADYCEYEGIVGVAVAEAAGFACGDVVPWPWVPADSTDWWQSSGFPSLPLGGGQVAVLPAGVTLTQGPVSCTSETKGVRCVNTASDASFWVSATGFPFRLEGKVDPKARSWSR